MNTMKPTNARPGFTLIELLVVVVFIGILAVISLFQSDRVSRRADVASMQADLRALLTQQELFHQINLRYADITEMTDFAATRGVTIVTPWVQPEGFAAVATHIRLADNTCAVFVGPAPAGVADPATDPGVITCSY
jgi:prepilin-type N-terminal cleavage/methylation domain-containing protein